MVFPATDEIYAAMKAHDLNSGIEARGIERPACRHQYRKDLV